MDYETPILSLQLPIIDFSNRNLSPGEPQWDLTRADVKKALQDYGCFEAYFDRISIEHRNTFFQVLEELFKLPLQTKQRHVSEKPFHGYIRRTTDVQLVETMIIEDIDKKDKLDAFTEKLWPQGNTSFSTKINSFSKMFLELDTTIRRMIMESFGLEKYIDGHFDSTKYHLRMIRYEGPKSEETELAIKTHTDKTFVTILHTNHVEGLEVQMKDKNWIKVKPSQDSFIVMIGDSLHIVPSVSPCDDERKRDKIYYRIICYPGHIVSSPDELVDEEHPRLFKPFEHIELLKFYVTEAGKRSQFPLKSYCGM